MRFDHRAVGFDDIDGAHRTGIGGLLLLQVNHRLTVRLRALADVSYTYSTFTQPLFGVVTLKPHDQAITAHVGLNYTFTEWLSAVLDYTHYDLTSSEAFLIQPYTRNMASIGITLTY